MAFLVVVGKMQVGKVFIIIIIIINHSSGLHIQSCLQTPSNCSSFARNKALSIGASFLKSKGYVNLRKSHFIYGFVQQVYVR